MNLSNILSKEEIIPLIYYSVLLFTVCILGVIFTKTSFLGIFTLAFAILFYLTLPGYFVLLNFKNLNGLERIILGMVVSSAVVPSLLYLVNILGVNISMKIVTTVIIVIISISLMFKSVKN